MSVLFNAFGAALNLGLYLAWGYWWSLAAAAFCGLMFLASLVAGDY